VVPIEAWRSNSNPPPQGTGGGGFMKSRKFKPLGTLPAFWLSVRRRMRNLPPFFLLLLASSLGGAAEPGDAVPSAPREMTPPATEDAESGEDLVIIEGLTGESEMEHSFEDGITFYRHGVTVRHGGMELAANQVAVSESTGDIIADGNVRLRTSEQYFVGDHVEYNFKTGSMKSGAFRSGFAPFYARGLELEGNTEEQSAFVRETFLTSDDVKNPAFKIRAKEFRIIPGRRVVARNATIYAGDTPVFFLPYYKRDLTSHAAFWRVVPGFRGYHGAYLLSSYHFPITTNVSAGINLDLYQKRGFGLGPDLTWKIPRWGDGEFRYYYINDNEPRTDPDDRPIREDRHRLNFSHRATLRPNLTAKVVAREQSDPYIIRDFFEGEYRQNTQPNSFLEINQTWSNWSLDLLAQPQLNSFFQTIERLPDIRLSGIRQQIGESPLFYESETSVAYLRFEPGLDDDAREYAAMRADSFHQILWPQTYFGWLNFVPRVGGRFTQYGETEGQGTSFDERSRFVFNTGAEVSAKASRVWRGIENKFWDVRELRHIIQPSINYVFVPSPNREPRELPLFDREIPSLRLLPIDYPDYNAIDSVDSQNVLRFTLFNKLQTKRDDGIQNLVNWGLYTDWRLNPRPGQSTFADIYSDLDLRPRTWLSLNSQTRFDIKTRDWNAAYHTATFTPNSTWNWRAGHRYFRGGPEFGPDSDNNTIFSSLYFKFNENWAARLTHHFEARDGTLEEQYYTIYRDFRSWTGALTFRYRDNRDRSGDFAVAFTFQLKAFPRYPVGGDSAEHSFLLGS
jgi:LPS-assembly protein